MTAVAITCIQLLRDVAEHRDRLEAAGLEVRTPQVPGQHLEGAELAEAIAGCIGVIAGDDRFYRRVFESSPELRAISKWGVGTDGIDFAAASDHGVTVTNTPHAFDDEVADVALGYLVMLARQLHVIDREVREGRWAKPVGASLGGRTLGVVGVGSIGRAMARRGQCAGMSVIASDPSPASRAEAEGSGVEVVPIDELLARSDAVSLHCPLTPDTRHLIDGEALARMRPGAWLINTARGEVVDGRALADSLDAGHLRGAALDVFEDEPLEPTSRLATRDDVILGSHNASNTKEASDRTHARAIDNLLTSLDRSPW